MPITGSLEDVNLIKIFPVADQVEASENTEYLAVHGVSFSRSTYYNAAGEIVAQGTWEISNGPEITSATTPGELAPGGIRTILFEGTNLAYTSTVWAQLAFEDRVCPESIGRIMDKTDQFDMGYTHVGVVDSPVAGQSDPTSILATFNLNWNTGWGDGLMFDRLHKPVLNADNTFVRCSARLVYKNGFDVCVATNWLEVD